MSRAPAPARARALRPTALLVALGLMLRGPLAVAQPQPPKTPQALPQRSAQVVLDGGIVKITMSYREVVDAEITKKLLSGLPTVIAMRVYVFREAGGDPIALTAKTCRIVYDLWDEVFRIQLTQPGGQTNP